MSENLSADSTPEKMPIHRVKWKGSVAEIYDFTDQLEGYPEVLKIYDRSDFQSPIERVQITVGKVDLNGEQATALKAEIKLDRTHTDRRELTSRGLLDAFISTLGKNAKFVPYNNIDEDLRIEATAYNNVHRVAHAEGCKLLVWANSETKIITVANHLKLSSRDGVSLEVLPPVDGTLDLTSTLNGFFMGFMRTIDFASGLYSYNPQSNQLRRTYAIGKEVNRAKQMRPNSGVGRTAMQGSGSSTQKVASNNSAEKNQPHTVEDIPEVEIIDSKLSLDDVGGLEQVKKTLRDIATSFQHPEVMEKWGATRPQGVLLYGEPGTGKTMLAQALANEIGAEMWVIQSTDIYEKWLGNSESHIKDIFNRARQHQERLVLFFDEFDSIVGITENPSAGGSDNARNAVAGIFKQEMNSLAKDNPDVLVVAATNDLDRIDPSLVRSGRFDHKIYIPMPDQEARSQILSNIVAKLMLNRESDDFRVFGDDLDIATLAEKTDGMSGSDITELFRRLGLSRAMQEARTSEQQNPLSQEEIEQEIRRFRTSG